MKNTALIVVFTILLTTSCKNREPQVENMRTSYDRFIVDTVAPGIKYEKTFRGIDPEHPPVLLDFSKTINTYPIASLDLSKYYNNIRYYHFSHPDSASGKGYYKNHKIEIVYERGMSTSTISSFIKPISRGFIVGDMLNGIYLYDTNNKVIDTVILNNVSYKVGADWDDTKIIEVKGEDLGGFTSLTTFDNNEVVFYFKDSTNKFEQIWYDFDKEEPVLKRILKANVPFSGLKIDDSTYYGTKLPFLGDSKIFLYLMTAYGDTISVFEDTMAEKIVLNRNYNRPENTDSYILGDKLHIRRSYNDTLYILDNQDKLTAKYIIDLGKKRVDPYNGLFGDKKDMLLPIKWVETKDFILFTFSQDLDTPNNRKRNSVKYFITMYDKANGKIYRLNSKDEFPDNYLITSRIESGIPFFISDLEYNYRDNTFYVVYDKESLKKITDHPDFRNFSQELQLKTNQLHNEVAPGSLLLMVIN